MNTAPNTGRRWALSPVDSRSHLLAEAGSAPTGMLVTDCGLLLPCAVDTSTDPPRDLRCSTCAQGASQACVQFPVSDTDSATGLSPELVASLALRRTHDGGVAKAGDRYLDRGHPAPGYLSGAFDELINAGLLALADEDPYGCDGSASPRPGESGMRTCGVRVSGRACGCPNPDFPPRDRLRLAAS